MKFHIIPERARGRRLRAVARRGGATDRWIGANVHQIRKTTGTAGENAVPVGAKAGLSGEGRYCRGNGSFSTGDCRPPGVAERGQPPPGRPISSSIAGRWVATTGAMVPTISVGLNWAALTWPMVTSNMPMCQSRSRQSPAPAPPTPAGARSSPRFPLKSGARAGEARESVPTADLLTLRHGKPRSPLSGPGTSGDIGPPPPPMLQCVQTLGQCLQTFPKCQPTFWFRQSTSAILRGRRRNVGRHLGNVDSGFAMSPDILRISPDISPMSPDILQMSRDIFQMSGDIG